LAYPYWVGSGRVRKILGRVGLGHKKLNHVQLWVRLSWCRRVSEWVSDVWLTCVVGITVAGRPAPASSSSSCQSTINDVSAVLNRNTSPATRPTTHVSTSLSVSLSVCVSMYKPPVLRYTSLQPTDCCSCCRPWWTPARAPACLLAMLAARRTLVCGAAV